MGHKECLAGASNSFAALQVAGEPVDVNLKRDVYCRALAEGGVEDWQFAWQRFLSSQVAINKDTDAETKTF